jgi:hypothetical protein
MNIRSALCSFGALLLGSLLLVPAAKAGQQDQLVKFTFSQPMEVPGTVLQPGDYWFKIYDQKNDPQMNIIQVYTGDFSHLVADLPAIPEQHMATGYGTNVHVPATDGVELQVAEGDGTHPAALLGWIYPSGYTGHQFVYSGSERSRLSEMQAQTILLPLNSSSEGSTYNGD